MNKVLALCILVCIGGFATEYDVVKFDNNWAEKPLFNLVSETPSGVEIIFSTHEIVIEDTDVDGTVMKTLGVPGIFLPNQAGAPNLAGSGRYVAIPQGAHATATVVNSRTEVYYDIDVAPAFEIPAETDDSPLCFEKDRDIYSRNAYYPESPVTVSEPRQIRGVDVVIVGVTPFQYNPVTKELIVYKDLQVRVDFIGGNGHFGEDRLRSRFWEPVLQNQIMNYNSLPEIDFYDPARISGRAGYEYIIIVPDDAAFESWGDTIRHWRQLQGIPSEVFTLTEIGGSDSASIKDFLEDAYDNWDTPPVAFLLLSDFPASGDAYGITSPRVAHPDGQMTSDNWYADFDGDILPELHYARICAQTEEHLEIMINKFLSYERDPYTSAGFYDNPLVACGWQTSRWFQICAEVVRGFLINGLGKNPAREYNIYSGTPAVGDRWSTATNTNTVVQYWYNVGWLPDTLNQENAAWWDNGSAAGITNAINSGAFIVQHRDHGGVTGWGEPDYDVNDLDNLTNTEFTFVFSSNCLTGHFDNPNESFTEKFHRIEYGALGVNAATRVSYSFVNDAYVWGVYDCLWPEFDPGYPTHDMTGYDDLRPCMAMTSGKYYLDASGWPSNPGQKAVTYGLFHHHGDCFITLYSEIPQDLTVIHEPFLEAGHTSFTVTANARSVIALTVNGEIIGVAEGTGAPVSISIPAQSEGETMLVTVTLANYRRYAVEVPVLVPNPDLDIQDYSGNLSANTMELTGVMCSIVLGKYVMVNPDDWQKNVDLYDGPGNVDLTLSYSCTDLTAYGSPWHIPQSEVDPNVNLVGDLALGTAALNLVQVVIDPSVRCCPNLYVGTVTATGECNQYSDSDEFTLKVNVISCWNEGLASIFASEPRETGNYFCWTTFGLGETGYNLYRYDQNAGSFEKLNESPLVCHEYEDRDVTPVTSYQYKFGIQMDASHEILLGPLNLSAVGGDMPVLMQNVPNPWKDFTEIRFTVTHGTEHVSLKVYDASGKLVKTLINGSVVPGLHSVSWQGKDDAGRRVASGVYFCKYTVDDCTLTKKMLFLR